MCVYNKRSVNTLQNLIHSIRSLSNELQWRKMTRSRSRNLNNKRVNCEKKTVDGTDGVSVSVCVRARAAASRCGRRLFVTY